MDLLERLSLDALAATASRAWLDAALRHFHVFTLVVIRMSGLMIVGPVFGRGVVPTNVRVMLVFAMSLLIVPAVAGQSQYAFDRLDADQKGRLTRDEIPARPPLPRHSIDYALAALGELALGLALGLGVFTILSGLQIAGELIDQQSGTALGGIFDPGLNQTGSLSGRMFSLLGVTVFLCMEPLNGHLLMISALLETFQTFPVGAASVPPPVIELLRDLVHQSLVLGLQIAAPLLATMSLVALAIGFLGHTIPQINVLVVGFPVRVGLTMLVLALTFSGASRALVDVVPAVIDQFRFALAAL